MDESTTGTADEAAAARDSGTALRSEQMMSNVPWLKTKREPVEMSVADASIIGPCSAIEIAEGGAVEEDFVVQLRTPVRTAPNPSDERSPQ